MGIFCERVKIVVDVGGGGVRMVVERQFSGVNEMGCYEFIGYAENGAETRIEAYAPTDGAACAQAGTMSKKINGPVDIARIWPTELFDKSWEDRYITTASPSEFHVKGFRLERLA